MNRIIKYIVAAVAVALWAALSIWSGMETFEIIDKRGIDIELELVDIAIMVTSVNLIALVMYLAGLAKGQSVK